MGRSTDISSGYGAASVTPSDSTVIPTTRALLATGAGNVAVRMANGDLITIAYPANTLLSIQVDRVYSTGTTATGLQAFY